MFWKNLGKYSSLRKPVIYFCRSLSFQYSSNKFLGGVSCTPFYSDLVWQFYILTSYMVLIWSPLWCPLKCPICSGASLPPVLEGSTRVILVTHLSVTVLSRTTSTSSLLSTAMKTFSTTSAISTLPCNHIQLGVFCHAIKGQTNSNIIGDTEAI